MAMAMAMALRVFSVILVLQLVLRVEGSELADYVSGVRLNVVPSFAEDGVPSFSRIGKILEVRVVNQTGSQVSGSLSNFRSRIEGSFKGIFNSTSKQLVATACIQRMTGSVNWTRHGYSNEVLDCETSLSIDFPEFGTIASPSITGQLRSLRSSDDDLYFPPESIFAHPKTYNYTRLEEAKEVCPRDLPDGGLGSDLENSLPVLNFHVWNPGSNTSSHVTFDLVVEEGALNVHGFVHLSDNHVWDLGGTKPQVGEGVLAVEGLNKSGLLCLTACRTFVESNGTRDCSIHVKLRFWRRFNIHQRSLASGSISSVRSKDDPLYFEPILFGERASSGFLHGSFAYGYSRVEEAKVLCKLGKPASDYPAATFYDLDVYANATSNIHGEQHAMLTTLTVQNEFRFGRMPEDGKSKMNVSFDVTLVNKNATEYIAAEGFYDPRRGTLCMVGCKNISTTEEDCKIFIQIDYPRSTNSNGVVSGFISSLRENNDALHFETLEITSERIVYLEAVRSELEESKASSSVETVALTFEVVAIMFQIVRSNRLTETRPYVSLVMIFGLGFGYMVQFLMKLGFAWGLILDEPVFSGGRFRRRKIFQVLPRLREDDILAAVIRIVAVLLLSWLARIVWKSRTPSINASDVDDPEEAEETQTTSVEETTILLVCLPTYACAMSLGSFFMSPNLFVEYGELVRDFFLLPQFVGYRSWNLDQPVIALSPVFYLGLTLARLVKRFYNIFDLVKGSHNIFHGVTAIYTRMAWNFGIACGSILLAWIIFLQQRRRAHQALNARAEESSTCDRG